MSGVDESEETGVVDKCCGASCGTSELDDVKMKPCNGCDLVRYCSDACQEDHRPEHEVKCKKRAAELRDEILFRQPEGSHRGDCPICCVPLPIEDYKYRLNSCCGKIICNGCSYANNISQRRQNMPRTCPFCRYPLPGSEEELDNNLRKRVEANDPTALRQMGLRHFRREEYDTAIKYWTKAAALGDVDAHHNLSVLYSEGKGVEKDEKKELYHLEEAAIAGHPDARHNLAICEGRNGRTDRAVKHLIIAANLGHNHSMNALKRCYKDGDVSKEDFAAALRAHHAAVKATKSENRESASEAMKLGP